MTLSLANLDAFVINLDRSRKRWINCHERLSGIFDPERIVRVSGVDGAEFCDPEGEGKSRSAGPNWSKQVLTRLRAEGVVGDKHVPDPVRVALCMSHQRALGAFLKSGKPWGMVFEDDVKPTKTLHDLPDRELRVEIPDDAELVFLHGRVKARRSREESGSEGFPARHGIGLEAQLVSREGAMKMIRAFRPMVVECDVQMVTFLEGYGERHRRNRIWRMMEDNGKTDFTVVKGYGLAKALFAVDDWMPSVKFQILREAARRQGDREKVTRDVREEPKEVIGEISEKPNPCGEDSALDLNPGSGLGFAVCHFNPSGYEARLRNFEKFAAGLEALGRSVVVVELAIGDPPFELPDSLPNVIRVRSRSVLWHKEALLNIGMARLDRAGFKNVGWLDADLVFPDGSWFEKTREVLERKRLCQVFESVDRFFPDVGRQVVTGAAYDWVSRGRAPMGIRNTGYGWAMKAEVWRAAGLYDAAVIGGGDYEMWRAVFSGYLGEKVVFGDASMSSSARGYCRNWAAEWSKAVRMEVGYPSGVRIQTLPHGKMNDRRYNQREGLLRSTGFDPGTHLVRRADGVLEWSEAAPSKLISGVADYFTNRKEDFGLKAG